MPSHHEQNRADEDRRYREEFGVSPHAHESPSIFDAGGAIPDRVGTMKAYAYRGLGPKGYRRSDERIHEDVCEALTEDADLDPSSVEVSVDAGEVTLSGTVSSRQASGGEHCRASDRRARHPQPSADCGS